MKEPHLNGSLEQDDSDTPIVMLNITDSPTALTEATSSTGETNSQAHDSDEDPGSEEHDDEENDDDDEDDEEDEDEPTLKYERIGESVPDLLKKDSASSLAIANDSMIMGTHNGFVHVLELSGKRIKSYRPHTASVAEICIDSNGEFIASASMDGKVVILSLNVPESYSFDMKRPMKTVALEPNFSKRSTRAFVCGGVAGDLVLHEKGWLGHKETILDRGEGPIWQVRWKGRLIAWANDLGVKIYDTISQTRLIFIDRPPNSPRADLFKCTLDWEDDNTLLIGWADYIKIVRVRDRQRTTATATSANQPPLLVEITAILQLDCMVSGIVSLMHQSHQRTPSQTDLDAKRALITPVPSSLLVLTYSPPDTSFLDEMTQDRVKQARKPAERPELRILSHAGEELSADCISVADFQSWWCNDYELVQVAAGPITPASQLSWIVLSPKDLVLVRRRDRRDHVAWLLEQRKYEEALEEIEDMESSGENIAVGNEYDGLSASEIGLKYIEHLVNEGDFSKAAQMCPKVCGHDSKRWEQWIFVFAEKHQLQIIIPYVPTVDPRLDHLVYEMILAHFLTHDRDALLKTIKDWPKEIYDVPAVIVAVLGELDRSASSSRTLSPARTPNSTVLMECLAELYIINRQPGKALTYFLRLRRPNVFDLIRDNNLFTDVQDQVLLLVEFDHELMEKRRQGGETVFDADSDAIRLLVDNIHSIPIVRVVQQLQDRPKYLFYYLDALFFKDPDLVADYADLQVKLYADCAVPRLIDFLRTSTEYNLEMAYNVCQEKDLVPEMVFLLGHMGNNKKALTLIIERLGDVHRAIEFAKEQADDDLWEDLLKYAETRPNFIRGLLENVGPEINPIRLIRRIKNGLEIPGLKEALIKILQDFHLQISLLEGCQTILNGDSTVLSKRLQTNQTRGFFSSAVATCPICKERLQRNPQGLVILFLCRHVVHSTCVKGGESIPPRPEPIIKGVGLASHGLSGKLMFENSVRARLDHGCPVCHQRTEGMR